MTEPIDGPGYDLTGYLADQIDAFAGMIEQRDLARSVAVGLEGELHAMEIERDAALAQLHDAMTRIEDARGVARTASMLLSDALDGKR